MEAWIEETNSFTKNIQEKLGEKILMVQQKHQNQKLKLIVNYDERLISFFKEFQILQRIKNL